LGLEGAIAIAEQDAHGAIGVIGDDRVRLAVQVEIA
jgi:hypothetical protein